MPLAEADPGLTNMAMDASPNARYAADESLLVRFYDHPRMSNLLSKEEGRPIYKNETYVSIMVPGNKDSIVIRPATQVDVDRFPRHYAAYKNNEEEYVEGTLLEMWPVLNRAQVEELKHFNVRTVEQLAELSDSHAQNFMAINSLKAKAKIFLEAAKDGAVTQRLQDELEERDNRIAALEEALADLGNKVKAQAEHSDDAPNSKRNTKSGGRRSGASSGE